MAKEKKVSIKYYINTTIAPIKSEGIELFPLYARITYDRKTTRFKVVDIEGHQMLLDPKKAKISELVNDLYSIENLIQYEVDLLGDKFEIKGISKRIEHIYTEPLVEHIRGLRSFIDFMTYSKEKNWTPLENIYDPNLLYYIGKYDTPNLFDSLPDDVKENLVLETLLWQFAGENQDNFLKLYTFHWITGNLKEKFSSYISSYKPMRTDGVYKGRPLNILDDYSFDNQHIEKYIRLIDEAINKRIKWLS